MKKAKYYLVFIFLLLAYSGYTQSLMQGTIKPGANANEVEVWLKPNFDNSTTYLFQLIFPIAFPASANPQPTGITVTQDPAFVTAFGTYNQSVFTLAQNTGGTEKFFSIFLIRSGSTTQTWTTGAEFKVLTVTFNYSSGATTFQPKLADYQDGGSSGQGGYYASSALGDEYITTNSIGNFYAAPGLSVVGGDASAGYAQISGGVLPLKLTGLKAYQKGTGVEVDWTTLSESNMDRFVVERSADGRNFTAVGTIAAAGNSTSRENYSWLDMAAITGANYYRIKSIELDGSASYTAIVAVNIDNKDAEVRVYPNPVSTGIMNLQLNNLEEGNYRLSLYNASGQLVLKTRLPYNGGRQQIGLPVKVPNGSYQLYIENDKQYKRTLRVNINY